jgi:cytochrome P450
LTHLILNHSRWLEQHLTPPGSTPATGPRACPVAGHAFAISGNLLEFLRSCAAQWGDLIPLRFFGKGILFVNHPDYIGQVLAARQRDVRKGVSRRSDRLLLGEGIPLSEGEAWRRQRRRLQPFFTRERQDGYGADVVALTERALAEWRSGEVRDIAADLGRLAMAVVARCLLGIDLVRDAPGLSAALEHAVACRGAHARSVGMLAPGLPTPENLRLARARDRIDAASAPAGRARTNAADPEENLLAALCHARDAERSLTDSQLRDEVRSILIGGYETAADLLAWTGYLVYHYPGVEAKLRAEIAAVVGERAPTVADVPRLRYTGMVVAEVLRLYPPAPILTREAVADLELGGHRVAKGTELVVSQWVMHRDARYFAQPETFDPDRWADGLAKRLPRFAYFPFGGGPRVCLGQSFATTEAILILASVVQRFHLELAPGHQVIADPIPTLHPKGGLPMMIEGCRGSGVGGRRNTVA